MIKHTEALERALDWAERAELLAQKWPTVPSGDFPHIDVAYKLSSMWTNLARELTPAPMYIRTTKDMGDSG